MPDIVDTATRSRMMSAIRGKDTRPEMEVRRALHRLGFRYRLHDRQLPGRPDLVFPGRKSVIFVHGCYWHRHAGCPNATLPKTRTEFWTNKFNVNVARDSRDQAALAAAGWRIGIVWECAIRRSPTDTIAQIELWLQKGTGNLLVE